MAEPLTLSGVTVRQEQGRRGTDIYVLGRAGCDGDPSFDESRLLIVLFDAERNVLAVEDGRLDMAQAVDGELPFSESVRLPASLVPRIHTVEIRWVAVIEEVAHTWTVPGAELEPALPGQVQMWRGQGATVLRSPVEDDGDVRITVNARCPLNPTYRYERYGDIHLTILDADSGVLFHDRTSFGTFGGTDSDAFLNERLRPKYYQLNGAYRYVFSLVTKRSLSSDSVVVGAGDMLSGEDDE